MIRTGLLKSLVRGYKYKNPKTHLDGRQQTGYTRNKRMNKWNRDCIACFVKNIQNCAGCADNCIEYTRKSMTTTGVSIAITQVRMCVLDNLERKTGKTGSRASTLIWLIESCIITFISSPVSAPLRAMASISRIVLNDQRKKIGISQKDAVK